MTQAAYTIDGWPIRVTRVLRPLDSSAFTSYLSDMNASLERLDVHVHIVDSSPAAGLSREQMTVMRDWMEQRRVTLKQYCRGVGMVISDMSPVRRFGIAAMMALVSRPPIPHRLFSSDGEAMFWAQRTLGRG